MSTKDVIKNLASVDILTSAKDQGALIGRPFYLDYEKACVLVPDAWKMKVGGIPQGTFLMAFYENEEGVSEALLLRALGPKGLPTDNDVTSSMIEYYKDNLQTAGKGNKLDDFTRYQFSFSGLECRILGTFYKDNTGNIIFGADLENFYSAHNYTVYKPSGKVLEQIVNYKDLNEVAGGVSDVKIGSVRYSSSLRFQDGIDKVPVYISPKDFIGKRTALFGMTRTGKSNTVKKIIEATVEISEKAKKEKATKKDSLDPFTKTGLTKDPVGQIIFDINGEYANPNLQDEGTAIFDLFKNDVIRYSVMPKDGFKVMKVNFYNDIYSGFALATSSLNEETGDYVASFRAVDFAEPTDKSDVSAITRFERKKAAYFCCLHKAGFKAPAGFKVKFSGNKDLNKMVKDDGTLDPSVGITLEEASNWFTTIWDKYNDAYFTKYKNEKGHEWADEDLKALLVFLTRKKTPGGSANVSGYIKLRDITNLHTDTIDKPFDTDIIESLRSGKIVIVDLSQGDPKVQELFSDRICVKIFEDAMKNFTATKANNFIQFYFEEAHNLFPKADSKDLKQIYNRLAKEGAKLNLGLIYATQEVSSISSNILKNTQNWFIAHLNNEDELKELRKYYDFTDFTTGLTRFSPAKDKGFVRMKTYSNPFVVPVQIDRFTAKK